MTPEERAMAEAICAYLEEHPLAADTIGGIAEWWIGRQRIRTDVEKIARVVGCLTEMQILEAVTIGGRVAYRLARRPAGGVTPDQ